MMFDSINLNSKIALNIEFDIELCIISQQNVEKIYPYKTSLVISLLMGENWNLWLF